LGSGKHLEDPKDVRVKVEDENGTPLPSEDVHKKKSKSEKPKEDKPLP